MGAVVLLALLAPLQMWPWLSSEVLPAGDALGYATAIEHVRRHLVGDAGLASWCAKWFGGTTHFTSDLKEIAMVPLEAALGPIAGIKVMLLLARVVAGLGMYALVLRLFAAPAAALVASYAYAWGTAANIQVGLGGHLDVVLCYALFPMLVRAAIGVADGSVAAAIATGALLASIFCLHYAQGVVSWVVVGLLVVLRPWRARVAPDRRQLAIVLATFAVLAAAPLVTSVVDQAHHALIEPGTVEAGRLRFIEQSPFLFLDRRGWLDGWIATHRPEELIFSPDAPLVNERRYLGVVALAACAAGWAFARRRRSVRRWYQTFLLLFLVQWWLAMGSRSLVWQLGRAFHWADETDTALRTLLTVLGLGALGWTAQAFRRRSSDVDRERCAVRLELGLGVALVCFLAAHPVFSFAAALLPFLNGLRAPGHFFDLAPFAIYALLGVSCVALRRSRAGDAAVLAIGVLVAIDFWPDSAPYTMGAPAAPLEAAEHAMAALPQDDTLRVTMSPWTTYTDWKELGFVAERAPMGAAWGWLYWQSTRNWPAFVYAAMSAMDPDLDDETRARLLPVTDTLMRIGRLKYVLEEVDDPPLLVMPAGWTRRAASDRFALWEGPGVLPFARATSDVAVAVGRDVAPAAVERAVHDRRLLLTTDTLDAVPEPLVSAAAFVAASGDDVAVAALATRMPARVYGPDRLAELAAHLEEPRPATRPEVHAVAYERPRPDHIVLQVDTETAPAVAVVAEAYHPWWTATVDGVSARPVRAEIAFMAVPLLTAGRHTIDLSLRPPLVVSLADATTVTGWAVLVVLVVGCGVSRARRRRAAEGSVSGAPADSTS